MMQKTQEQAQTHTNPTTLANASQEAVHKDVGKARRPRVVRAYDLAE